MSKKSTFFKSGFLYRSIKTETKAPINLILLPFFNRCLYVAYVKISIVIPMYREEKNILPLYHRLDKVSGSHPELEWEYVFVNDGSPDNSIGVLTELAKRDRRVKVIDLSRNFGKEVALTAGIHSLNTDAVVCMDADLQHPPEVISKLIQKWREGAEIVATIRTSTERKPILRRIGSHFYYALMAKMSDLDMVSQTTDFRLLDRKVIAAFNRVTERQRLFRGIVDWMGFRKVYIEFEAGAREEGEPSYSYKQLWKLAINSITSFSLWPLRLTGHLGILISATSGLLLTWMLGNYLLSTKIVFTPLAIVVVANTLLIGIVLMAIGLVALYIGSIHTEVINRPLYIVRETFNFEASEKN
jgi:glycosyltransferase involved in cell wall biosynthesis